jgi:acyl-CoA synthetase (AMP-forming)/AMP-acid ligase II
VTSAIWEQAGLRVDDVRLIRRGTLPRTSSGKVRRRETRARYLAGTLDEARLESSEGEETVR